MGTTRNRVSATAFAITLFFSAAIFQPSTTSAQGDPSFGNPTLLDAIKRLQTAVASVQTKLDQVATSVRVLAGAASGNRLVTPAVFANPGFSDQNFILCNVANVSASPRHVKIDAVRGKDQLVFPVVDGSQALAAGFADGFPPDLGAESGFFYCRFTVLDGVASDIRGSVQSLNSGAPAGNIAVPAQ